MSATASRTGVETEGRKSVSGDLPAKTSAAAGAIKERAHEVKEVASARVAEIKDITAEKLHEGKELVQDAVREVDIEQFLLRGSVSGHPFRVELEDETGDRYLAFEFNLRTDDGDTIRFTGRKKLAPGSMEGDGGRAEREDVAEGRSKVRSATGRSEGS